jgi:plasmid stabilization system protein ParE
LGRVSWRPEAFEDLEEIERFVARDSATYARLLAQRIVDASARLAAFPDSGRIVPELQDERIREVIVRSYRVMYRVSSEEVEVVAVLHGARLLTEKDIHHD